VGVDGILQANSRMEIMARAKNNRFMASPSCNHLIILDSPGDDLSGWVT
jgi:hypothetical protein